MMSRDLILLVVLMSSLLPGSQLASNLAKGMGDVWIGLVAKKGKVNGQVAAHHWEGDGVAKPVTYSNCKDDACPAACHSDC